MRLNCEISLNGFDSVYFVPTGCWIAFLHAHLIHFYSIRRLALHRLFSLRKVSSRSFVVGIHCSSIPTTFCTIVYLMQSPASVFFAKHPPARHLDGTLSYSYYNMRSSKGLRDRFGKHENRKTNEPKHTVLIGQHQHSLSQTSMAVHQLRDAQLPQAS